MKKPTHPFFRWPTSLLWFIPLIAFQLLFWRFGGTGSVWWYIAIPTLASLAFINLFSSIWLGVSVLVILFLYCSVGSSGAPISFAIWEPTAWVNIREMRGLEMTEFEWFHWWPFKWLVAILCLNMSIVTIRKIPLNLLTVGVWTIHGGLIVMVLGCMVYFSQKVEGDVLVSRRIVEIQVPNGEPATMVVTPANSITVGDTTYTITDINPNWALMSGEDAGKETYSVSVSVQNNETPFVRQLIAGYPEYTEDILQSEGEAHSMARAKNVLGKPLVDDSLQMSLQYDAKDVFYVTQSGAIYIREIEADGTPKTKWIERSINKLPRFNDYISDHEDVWSVGATQLSPLNLKVSSGENDPIDNDIFVTSYLRYAYMNSRVTGGGDDLFPVAWVTLKKGEEAIQSVELCAFDPSLSTADTSLMTFRWLGNNKELDVLEQSLVPSLKADIFGKSYDIELTASDDFQQIGETGYSCKIDSIQNNLNIGGSVVSLAIVSIKNGDQAWDRWVFDNESMNRDVIEGEQHTDTDKKFIDENISMTYSAGGAPITIVGGTEDNGYRLLTTISGNTPTSEPLEVGKPFPLTEEVTLTIDRVEPYTFSDTRPTIVPALQRDPSASNMYSMVKVVVPTQEGTVSAWLPYHHYPFESQKEVVRRFQYKPTTIQLSNGKFIELMFSRKRAELSAPVALDSFEVDSHLGGFTGSTSSILNWRSVVKFLDGSDETMAVSVNDPKPHKDLWFFQSQWDPPDAASKGLNYTVLGVGNRHGVFPMLLGCCLTVAGMVWAFYIKPLIKRKRQQAIYSEVQK